VGLVLLGTESTDVVAVAFGSARFGSRWLLTAGSLVGFLTGY
jgi:hypothetical protein